jgi:hypothetical protein
MRCRQDTLAIGQSGKENVNVDSTALRPLPRLHAQRQLQRSHRAVNPHRFVRRLQPERAIEIHQPCRTSFRDDIEAERHAQITETRLDSIC